MPGVRVLQRRPRRQTHRTGIRHHQPLLEVEEVFRIDVVRDFFEVLPTRVTFRITQHEPIFEETWPLETSDIQHPLAYWNEKLFAAVFTGDLLEAFALDQAWTQGPQGELQRLFREYGLPNRRPWQQRSPEDFFTMFHLQHLNLSIEGHLDFMSDEQELSNLVDDARLIKNLQPVEFFNLGDALTDGVALQLIIRRREGSEHPHPLR